MRNDKDVISAVGDDTLPFPDVTIGNSCKHESVNAPDVDELLPKSSAVSDEDEEDILAVKGYLESLAKAKDPISGETLDAPILLREDVAHALFRASELVSELLDKRNNAKPCIVYEKRSFSADALDRSAVAVSEKPIRISNFLNRINREITDRGVKNLGAATVMRWLSDKGYLREERVTVLRSEKSYSVTDTSNSVGILSQDTVDIKTGEVKTVVLLSKEAQEFILDNLEAITLEAK